MDTIVFEAQRSNIVLLALVLHKNLIYADCNPALNCRLFVSTISDWGSWTRCSMSHKQTASD